MEVDKNILDGLSYSDEITEYSKKVNLLRKEFQNFIKEVDKMGFRCEFYPVDITIKVEEGIRTKFDFYEKADVAGDLIQIKDEYYKKVFKK